MIAHTQCFNFCFSCSFLTVRMKSAKFHQPYETLTEACTKFYRMLQLIWEGSSGAPVFVSRKRCKRICFKNKIWVNCREMRGQAHSCTKVQDSVLWKQVNFQHGFGCRGRCCVDTAPVDFSPGERLVRSLRQQHRVCLNSRLDQHRPTALYHCFPNQHGHVLSYFTVVLRQPAGMSMETCLCVGSDWLSSSVKKSVSKSQFILPSE